MVVLLQLSDIPEDWATEPDGTYKRIDYYWSKVLDQKTKSGQPRYYVLPKVIISVLTLAHGNADVERSLSNNKNTVNTERTGLGIHTINGLRMAKDEVNQVNEVHHLNLSHKQIRLVKTAKQVYSERLRKEKEESDKMKTELLGKKQEKEMVQKGREKTKTLNESLDIQEKTLAAEEKEFSNMLKVQKCC